MYKKITFLLTIIFCAFQMNAQNNVTLSVDMTDYISGGGSFTNVNINGTFNGWCGSCNTLTQVGMTNVYEITVSVGSGAMDYKFTVDGWTGQEMFAGGEDCVVSFGANHNRVVHVDGDLTVPTVCYNSCTACGTANTTSNVTFSVDMSDYISGGGTFTTVYVSGTFNSWGGTSNALSDGDGDDVWDVTLPINNGTILYKFQVDGWAASETLLADNCTLNDGTNINRVASFYAAKTLPEVCWESCADCGVAVSEPAIAAPTPTHTVVGDGVISIYSDAYTDIGSVNYNPGWGQATVHSVVSLAGNDAMKYANLNFQGTDWNSNPQDLSDNSGLPSPGYTYYLHLDYWANPDITAPKVTIVTGTWPNNKEFLIDFASFTAETWGSVDIPLSNFYNGNNDMDITDVKQLKVEAGGSGTLWLDNIYFYKSTAVMTPVELTYFKGKAKEGQNVLNWQTTSEENNSHFEIERSLDGENFETIDVVKGNGTTIEIQNYEYIDREISAATTYYRLRQVDFDDAFDYSTIISVSRDGRADANMKIYPVPVNNQMTIDFNAFGEEEYIVNIIDVTGKKVISNVITASEGANKIQMNTSSLPKGTYILQLQSNSENSIQQFVKMN